MLSRCVYLTMNRDIPIRNVALIHGSIFPGKNQYISPFSNFSWCEGDRTRNPWVGSQVFTTEPNPSRTLRVYPVVI